LLNIILILGKGGNERLIFNNKRCESEIVYDLLSSAKNDIKKTRLMYKANMTYSQFVRYLNILEKKDLIKKKKTTDNGEIYYTTDKGSRLLQYLNIVTDFLK